MKKNVLNLYAGVGGNRKKWYANVTAVENQQNVADAYAEQHPEDTIVMGDAHQYLLDHYAEFDFIWSSPPCQTHSQMDLANPRNKPRYADIGLYQEIIFLTWYYKGKWVVENVNPYYEPLIPPTAKVGRHLFWSNFTIVASDIPRPKNFINNTNVAGSMMMKEWLGIQYTGNVYYGSNHCPAQVLRNCVHPDIGETIFDQAFSGPPDPSQLDLFVAAAI
jgi:DNA (cytosine-5)-methyltransferase 1